MIHIALGPLSSFKVFQRDSEVRGVAVTDDTPVSPTQSPEIPGQEAGLFDQQMVSTKAAPRMASIMPVVVMPTTHYHYHTFPSSAWSPTHS